MGIQRTTKQQILNLLYDNGLGWSPCDGLLCALQTISPRLPRRPRLNGNPEMGPIVGNTFASTGGRPSRVLVCDPPPPVPPPPPRVLKDTGAGSATNKCFERKLSPPKAPNFFPTMCLY